MRSRLEGMRPARTAHPVRPVRSMLALAMTPAAWMTWSRAVFRAMVKLARTGTPPNRDSQEPAYRREGPQGWGQTGTPSHCGRPGGSDCLDHGIFLIWTN